jgi:hypothetical protein
MLGPDLLHQVCKNGFDMVYKKMIAVLKLVFKNVSEEKIIEELDAWFMHMPMYPHLRWFRHGISKTTRWTGKEYKGMFKIFLGIVKELLDGKTMKMIKAYLDILRMSHYESHTDSEGRETSTSGTQQLFEEAVDLFWDAMFDKEGPLITQNIIWYTPKLHYPQHYADYIRAKGSLPQSSTDRSEALHKNVRKAFDASGKGANCEDFMVRYEGRQTTMRIFVLELRSKAYQAEQRDDISDNELSDSESDGGGDETGSSEDEDEDEDCNEDGDEEGGTQSLRKVRRKSKVERKRKQRKLWMAGLRLAGGSRRDIPKSSWMRSIV